MTEYHKINAPFNRDTRGTLLNGEWCMPEFEYLANNEWEFTEKVDGTNIRLYFGEGYGYMIQGRTDKAQLPKPLLEVLHDLCTDIQDAVDAVRTEHEISELVVYGEGYGPKIQNGGKYTDKPSFVVFDVLVGNWWLKREDVDEFCKTVGLDSVPVIGYGTLYDAMQMVRFGTRTDNGVIINVNEDGAQDRLSSRWGDFEAEGIVARPRVSLFDRAGRRIITKIKAKDFR